MRRWLHIIAPAVALMVGTACVALWLWSVTEVRYLRADFWRGSFDGDREWRGDYLAAYRGQLSFESERIHYATPPATRPANRWAAEDAVGIRTPALRSFPFDGPLGFHFARFYSVTSDGSLHGLRLAFPLWAVLLPSSLPVLYPFCRLLLRRRCGAGGRSGSRWMERGHPMDGTGTSDLSCAVRRLKAASHKVGCPTYRPPASSRTVTFDSCSSTGR